MYRVYFYVWPNRRSHRCGCMDLYAHAHSFCLSLSHTHTQIHAGAQDSRWPQKICRIQKQKSRVTTRSFSVLFVLRNDFTMQCVMHCDLQYFCFVLFCFVLFCSVLLCLPCVLAWARAIVVNHKVIQFFQHCISCLGSLNCQVSVAKEPYQSSIKRDHRVTYTFTYTYT